MDETYINKTKYHIHITSKKKRFELNLKEVWQYKDLIWLFTKRSFQVAYKQTILGPAWIFINPVFTSIIYTFVFGTVAGMSTDGLPQILFYLCGTAGWTFFSTSITSNASTFTSNAGVFGKVYFPRLTVPISHVLSAVIKFWIQMMLVLGVLFYYVIRGEVHPHWEAWPLILVVLIHLGLLGMGLGIIISSMTTKYRDLKVLVGFGVQLLMYATPVVYPLSQLGDGTLKTLMMLNPITSPMEILRYAVLGKGTIVPLYVVVSWAITLAVVIIGIMIFNRVEKTFMDTV